MSFFDFLTIWGTHVEWLVRQLDWLVVFGGLLIFGAALIFVRMGRNPRSAFDFAEMFEGDNGKTSMAKFLAFIGGLTATWVVVSLAVGKNLSDLIFGSYLGILVAGKVATDIWGKKPDVDAKPTVDDDTTDASTSPATAPRPMGKRA